jgi:4,5-DOPA dioxygenase extradiol
MFTLMKNPYTPTWIEYFKNQPRPQAILSISAHWYGPGLAVTGQDVPD